MSADAVDWSKKLDTEVKISGIAQNAKAGPLLMTAPDDAILIRGLSEWNETTVGKEVIVEAVVRRVPGYPKANASKSQSMQGRASDRDTWVLDLKHYQVVD